MKTKEYNVDCKRISEDYIYSLSKHYPEIQSCVVFGRTIKVETKTAFWLIKIFDNYVQLRHQNRFDKMHTHSQRYYPTIQLAFEEIQEHEEYSMRGRSIKNITEILSINF